MHLPALRPALAGIAPRKSVVVLACILWAAGSVGAQPAPPPQTYVAAIGAAPLKAPPTADFSPSTTFTMEGWIYLSEVSTSASHLMGKTFESTADPYQSFALQLWSGNNLVFAQTNGTPGSMVFLNSPTAIPIRTWTHVAAVVGEGTMKIFVNGVLSASATSPGAPPNQPTVPFALGLAFYPNGAPNNNPFPGYARHVRFWNVARTATQIAAALGESLPTDAAGLVAAWPLDEAGGTTARDISGNGRALTVVGGSLSPTRAMVLEAGPFFTASTTAVTDGSLQYVNPKGAMIDFDSDGDLDLIEVQGYHPPTFPDVRTRVRAFRFQNGAYVDATDAVLGTVDMVAPSRTIVADFNGDGRADILLAGIGTDAIPWPGEQAKLLLQDATGHLLDMTSTNLPQHSTDFTHDCTVGDIDGDGDPDIYIGNLNVGDGSPRIYVNNGQGVFTEASGRLPADIADRSITYTSCLLTDINGDGRADLVLGGWADQVNNNEILINDGSGTFVRPANPLLPAKMFGADGSVVRIVSTDLNGDGKADLLLSATDRYVYAALQILLKQNDGTFTDTTAGSGITWSLNDTEIDRIDPVDLNADGHPDLVVHFASLGGSRTRLFLNRGDASFIEASDTFTRGAVSMSFHSGDVDGDGFVDLVTVNQSEVTFYRGLKRIELTLFYDAPAITTQPLAQTVTAGSSLTFTGAASGYPAPTYQWQKDGLNIGGATASSYTIASVSLGDAGVYTVVAANAAGSITSSSATLTIESAPVVTGTSAPRQLLNAGQDLTLSVSATNAAGYQWSRNGRPIAGATAASYAITNATYGASGRYQVVTTNSIGSTYSPVMFVRVIPTASEIALWGDQSSGLNGAVDIAAIAVGGHLALKTDGGTVIGSLPASLTDVFNLAFGDTHGLALKNDGTLVGWGSDVFGQASGGAGMTDIVAVAVGTEHSVALKNDGTVVAWGANWAGQCNPPPGLANVVAIAANYHHTLALKSDGSVVAWGLNDFGETSVPGTLSSVVAIATGQYHSLALKSDGTVVGWGSDFNGRSTPPAGLSNVVVIAAGAHHSLALRSDGTVIAWGSDAFAGPLTAPPSGLGRVLDIAAGSAHSVALRDTIGDTVPVITIQPVALSVQPGNSAVFSVTANGNGAPLSFQWSKDGAAISGATSPTLNLTTVQEADAGSYSVVVTNRLGSATSGSASLVVSNAPVFIIQPAASVTPNSRGYFTINVSVRTANLEAVSWSLQLASRIIAPTSTSVAQIDNDITATLSFGPVDLLDRGSFSLVATNSYGATHSRDATLVTSLDYISWKQAKFDAVELLDLAISGPLAVFGQDGLNNLVKFALGLEPKTDATSNLPNISVVDQDWVFAYARPAGWPNVAYGVEVSTNLVTWTSAGVTHAFVSDSDGTEIWSAKYPLAGAANVYFRLKVELP